MMGYKKVALLGLVVLLLLPGFASLEERAEQGGFSESTAEAKDAIECALGEMVALPCDVALTFIGFETGTRFRYYPSGGFSSATLAAKRGYQLLCLFIKIENNAETDFDTTPLLSMVLSHGKEYESLPRDTFFYRLSNGSYAGGGTLIRPGAVANGCLLFALPEEAEQSGRQIAVCLTYDEAEYTCVLRPSEGRLLMDELEKDADEKEV